AVEASPGDPEEPGAGIAQRGRQCVLFPWRAVVIPPHTEVQRQAVADFPIVLEEGAPFVLVNIANLEWIFDGIVPRLVCLVGAVDETELAHAAYGPGKENQKILHRRLTSGRDSARQSGYVRRVDSCHRSELRFSANRRRNGVHIIKGAARAVVAG